MTTDNIGYALSLVLVIFIFLQIKEKPFTLIALIRPFVIVALVAVVFLRSIPLDGNNLTLEIITTLIGCILGILCGMTTKLRVKEEAVLLSVGVAAIIFWCLGMVARSAFSLYSQHGGGPAIARFSIQNKISKNGWVAALVLMALVEVISRTVTLALRSKHKSGKTLKQIFLVDEKAKQA
jgi:hypothetical protein